MERNLNNDFERILKEHADQYRMYPSEKVWSGISRSLHPRRRWFGLGAILLLISGTFVTLMMINPDKNASIAATGNAAKPNTAELNTNSQKSSEDAGTVINMPDPASFNTQHARINLKKEDQEPVIAVQDEVTTYTQDPSNVISLPQQITATYPAARNDRTSVSSELSETGSVIFTESAPIFSPSPIVNQITDQDSYTKGLVESKTATAESHEKKVMSPEAAPWTIESAINSFRNNPAKKLTFQVYFTPTISYRKLTENKAFLNTGNPANPPISYTSFADINTIVTHKPDVGLELGFAGKYKITNDIRLRAGVQFNMNRYEIKAFNNPFEVATIALNVGGNRVESVNALSQYRNFKGSTTPDWLQNLYFQISAPVGAEIRLAGDENIQFGVASTIQPTYILGDRAYLISADYKNYAELPQLIRRWNVNTHFETFVAYSTGTLKWQVGPQVRYQLLSSFVKEYPVKENLFDFGLKVGVSLNQ